MRSPQHTENRAAKDNVEKKNGMENPCNNNVDGENLRLDGVCGVVEEQGTTLNIVMCDYHLLYEGVILSQENGNENEERNENHRLKWNVPAKKWIREWRVSREYIYENYLWDN